MRRFALVLSALSWAPMASLAAPGVNANLATPQEANHIDLGCLRGDLRATKYPSTHYDAATHERIMYNISACTGGFILGTNTDTWKTWHADIKPDGSMSGKDADGDVWTYDHRSKTCTNLATGRTCAKANLRHVCGS
ncbi:MAG TPA: hypothetical protein VGF71_03260 [Caulobacteraceae bacterium]